MNRLCIKLENKSLKEHYQSGMLKLFEVPVNHGHLYEENPEFFGYISTLGGGLANEDSLEQSFSLTNSKAVISSQASQKIYKGSSFIKTKIEIDSNSSFVFHNDANIFYPNSNFLSNTIIFAKENSKFFIVDGGFSGYANGNFKANLALKLFINHKLALYDNFSYRQLEDINAFFTHQYFYTILLRSDIQFDSINEENLKAYASSINETTVIRVFSDNNGLAIDYINHIKNSFLKQEEMSLISTR